MRNPTFQAERFKELVLYIADKSKEDPRFGAIKLNKILFYADFAAYRQLGRPITGAEYQHLSEGPAPKILTPMRKELCDAGDARIEFRAYYDRVQERIVPNRPAKNIFNQDEQRIVNEVIDDLWHLNGKDVTERSHDELAWKLTKHGEPIPYSAAWFSSDPLSMDEEELGNKVADKYKLRVVS
jgi:uncharacterized phage-associated protein